MAAGTGLLVRGKDVNSGIDIELKYSKKSEQYYLAPISRCCDMEYRNYGKTVRCACGKEERKDVPFHRDLWFISHSAGVSQVLPQWLEYWTGEDGIEVNITWSL